MAEETRGSVTILIGDLKAGGDTAAQPLWERYFDRLVHLARARIRASHAPTAVADEEDAALSAFDSFCRAARCDHFPQLADRDDLWRLLVVITQRKVSDQNRYARARGRGGGRVAGEADLTGADEREGRLEEAPGARAVRFRGAVEVDLEPTPEFAAELAEQYRRRLEGLGDEALRRVAVLKMEGYTDDEVAERMSCSRRSVQRKLTLIRQEWGGEGS